MCCLSITMYSWVGFSAVSALGLLAFLTVNNFATAFTDSWWILVRDLIMSPWLMLKYVEISD